MKTLRLFLFLFILSFTIPTHAQLWEKVASGGEFCVALRSDGTLWSWGFNGNGQLGINSLTQQIVPVQIGSDINWADVACGGWHCLAIKDDGTLWAWGFNGGGQLGINSIVDADIPVQVGSDNDWALIDAGQAHSVAIKTDGTLWAWGFNFYAQLGQLGGDNILVPTQAGTDNDWIKATAGGSHTLALKSDGSLWGCGADASGQVGDGTTSDAVESFIEIVPGTDFTDVSAGFEYSLAVRSDGTLWSWGFNGSGQLGTGDFVQQSFPVQVGTDNNWMTARAGSTHAFAIKQDQTLYGWGFNAYGEVGNGTTDSPTSPVQIGTDNDWIEIAPAKGFIIGSGVYGLHSTGRRSSQEYICATGSNFNGQLGNGTTTDQHEFSCETSAEGISVNEAQKMLSVYPNPSTEVIRLLTGGSANGTVYTITDMSGKQALSGIIKSEAQEINISILPPGIYSLNIGNHFVKIVKE